MHYHARQNSIGEPFAGVVRERIASEPPVYGSLTDYTPGQPGGAQEIGGLGTAMQVLGCRPWPVKYRESFGGNPKKLVLKR